MRMRTLLAVVLVLVICPPTALARKWTDSTGTYTVEAEFVDFKDGRVQLRKPDHTVLTIPIEKLGQADQEWVRAQTDGVSASPPAGPTRDDPVVGVQECSLFATRELKEEVGTLQAGDKVSVEKAAASALQVATAQGRKGWVRRCCLCTAAELVRRRKAGEVPANLVCIGAETDGRTFLYGGTMPIRNGQFALEARQAFWMDESAKGKTFTVASHPLRGDPTILFLYKNSGAIARLPILSNQQPQQDATGVQKRPSHTPHGDADAAVPRATTTSGSQQDSWQSDVRAFRKAVAAALDAVKPKTTGSGFGPPMVDTSNAYNAVAQFASKRVRWRITFLGLNAKGEVNFQENWPAKGKGTFLGKTEEFTAISLSADPTTVSEWRKLPRNGVVTCEATIATIVVFTRFSAGNKFAGWMPLVSVENAKLVK